MFNSKKRGSSKWRFHKVWEHPLLAGLIKKLECETSDICVGWGYKPSGNAARTHSERSGRRLLLLEDAFVRSMKPGTGQVYGLVADSLGIYYGKSGASDLLKSLNSGQLSGWMRDSPADQEIDTNSLISQFRGSNVSKYNWYPGDFARPELPLEPGVMVVDQTRGDTSIDHGGVRESDFDRMVTDALDEHPDTQIYIRSHPDHTYRNKFTCFSPWVFKESRVTLLPSAVSPAECFKFCDVVYAATSLMGMEALIHGKKVKTYGWNFYAGWGLTDDRCEQPGAERLRQIALERLFEAAYLQYSHYFDPDTGEPCGLGRILEHVQLQREVARENSGTRIMASWVPWKRSLAQDFFNSPGCVLKHADDDDQIKKEIQEDPDAKLLIWGAKPEPVESLHHVIRVEDGFLRSTGLGATFHRPLSWALDDQGIYFDPTRPSRLESILQEGGFSESELAQTEEVIEFLKNHRLSKYNLNDSGITWKKEEADGKKVILVPGQVELDASIKMGSPEVKTNGDLLRRVREEQPDAYLIFKCHPDLVAGARHGQLLPDGAEKIADHVATHGNIIDWLDLCDEVYTMTSTVGFEALLRGLPVRTYGIPFYAGWGLTKDSLLCSRRTRMLSVTELACGALIRYPRYLNPNSNEFTTAIQIARLIASGKSIGKRRPWYLRIVSILKALWVRIKRR